MKAAAPGAGEWMILLGGLDPEREDTDVVDPIGGGIEDYRAVRDDLARLTGFLLSYIAERFDLASNDE